LQQSLIRLGFVRPVTPKVAGSSPVAPAISINELVRAGYSIPVATFWPPEIARAYASVFKEPRAALPYAAIQAQSFHATGFTETDAIANGLRSPRLARRDRYP